MSDRFEKCETQGKETENLFHSVALFNNTECIKASDIDNKAKATDYFMIVHGERFRVDVKSETKIDGKEYPNLVLIETQNIWGSTGSLYKYDYIAKKIKNIKLGRYEFVITPAKEIIDLSARLIKSTVSIPTDIVKREPDGSYPIYTLLDRSWFWNKKIGKYNNDKFFYIYTEDLSDLRRITWII